MHISGQLCKRKQLRMALLHSWRGSDLIHQAPMCFWKQLCICLSMMQDLIEELKYIQSSRQTWAIKYQGAQDLKAKWLAVLFCLQDGTAPLWIASQMGHSEVVRVMLLRGAERDAARDVSSTSSCALLQLNASWLFLRLQVCLNVGLVSPESILLARL